MVDDQIAAHYELGLERDRLFREGEPRLELTRTLELLDRFLPSQPARLIDVGGGPWRILKPGGVVAAVGISRFAALLDGLWQGWPPTSTAVGTRP
jgi:hypothetical protein